MNMEETIALLGGDARQGILARLLLRDGHSVCTWGVPDAPNGTELAEAASAPRVILPAPLTRASGLLNGTELPLSRLWPLFSPRQRLYAGGVKSAEAEAAAVHGLTLSDCFAREELSVRNAVPTAEGAIEAAMTHLPVTLHATPCLVVGFGRIGKLLAHRLHGMGAEVTVSARKRSDLAWIDAFGYRALRTDALFGTLGRFRVIFNTVPTRLFDAALLTQTTADCLLIELASTDGFDAAAARALGRTLLYARGLPGKTAPETAARALRDTLYQIWREEE